LTHSHKKTRRISTSCSYVIDAYAWIEYFKASKLGEIAKEYIESEYSTTPTIVVSEISRKLSQQILIGKETQEGRQQLLEFIRSTSKIINLNFDTAAETGKIIEELRDKANGWSLADLIILSTARTLSGKAVTGDEHFRKVEDAIFIKA